MPSIKVTKNMSTEAIEGRIGLAKEVLLESSFPVRFKDFEGYNQFNTRASLLVQLLLNSENEAAIDVFVDLLRSKGDRDESES